MIPKILLVDDVAMFLELQKTFLKLSSVHVLTARDGSEALQIARKEHPDLIFLDMHMPVMSGAECCALIKQDRLLRSVPVVMVTSEGKETDKELCFGAGCDDFITKPIDRVLYLEKARKYLPAIDRRELRLALRAKAKFRACGLTLSGEILDVGARGVYIATDYEIKPDTVIDLVFALTEADGALVQARGRVAWVNSGYNRRKPAYPPGFGVEFVSVTDVAKCILDRLMEMHGKGPRTA